MMRLANDMQLKQLLAHKKSNSIEDQCTVGLGLARFPANST